MNAPQSSGTSFPRLLRLLLRFVFGSGVVLLLLGQIISFYPGAEEGFYTFTACLLLAGLFVPNWLYRIASVVLIAYCISGAVDGHRRGIRYQHLLEQRGLSQPHR